MIFACLVYQASMLQHPALASVLLVLQASIKTGLTRLIAKHAQQALGAVKGIVSVLCAVQGSIIRMVELETKHPTACHVLQEPRVKTGPRAVSRVRVERGHTQRVMIARHVLQALMPTLVLLHATSADVVTIHLLGLAYAQPAQLVNP